MANQPNILVILTDDHGQWAAGCYGNRELHTPSMDWLAATGARMDRAFTPCPVCSPARASFHTGRMPSMHGVHDYLEEPGIGKDHPGIRGQPTLAMLLQEAGYHTGLVGKWHCNDAWIHQPGFDFWFSMSAGTQARFGDQAFCDNGRIITKHGQQAPMLTDQALRFLRQRDDSKPFFLFLGYTDTHSPFRSLPERLVSRYRGCAFDDIPHEQRDARQAIVRFAPKTNETERREELAQYYASVTMVDEQMGRVFDELEGMALLDDTIIVYTADHGHMNGHHGLYTKGNATVPQNFYEESILVPCLWRFPGAIAPGQVRTEMVDHCDLYATLLDAAGVQVSEARRTEINAPGRSYLPMLRGESMEWRDAQFGEYGNARMARTARWKLIRRFDGPNGRFPDELYDLQSDPRERVNVFEEPGSAAVVDELSRRMDAFFDQYESPDVTGREIGRQPKCNNHEPWRLTET